MNHTGSLARRDVDKITRPVLGGGRRVGYRSECFVLVVWRATFSALCCFTRLVDLAFCETLRYYCTTAGGEVPFFIVQSQALRCFRRRFCFTALRGVNTGFCSSDSNASRFVLAQEGQLLPWMCVLLKEGTSMRLTSKQMSQAKVSTATASSLYRSSALQLLFKQLVLPM